MKFNRRTLQKWVLIFTLIAHLSTATFNLIRIYNHLPNQEAMETCCDSVEV